MKDIITKLQLSEIFFLCFNLSVLSILYILLYLRYNISENIFSCISRFLKFKTFALKTTF